MAEEPVVEEPVEDEDKLPPAMSPALEELSEDVAGAHVEPEAEEAEEAREVRAVEEASRATLQRATSRST